ncbi:MAG: hypothetical protein JSV96_14820 [Candidatus Aminicenantes bacterium]|nr:MAG: hypothetical protein JSV96_14820 [Candidatus Aminicenantes bacterium]
MIEEFEYKPYQFLKRLPNKQITKFVLYSLQRVLQDSRGKICSAQSNGMILGLASLILLTWDEQIFGMKMAAIPHLFSIGNYQKRKRITNMLISEHLETCKKLQIQNVSVRLNIADAAAIHTLEQNGFKLMDIIVIFVIDLKKMPIKKIQTQFILREYEQNDIYSIVELARHAFKNYFGRFHLDPTLKNKECTELYAQWAHNLCKGDADKIFVAKRKNKVIGFTAFKIHQDIKKFGSIKICEMELGAISPKVRKLGVYHNLYYYGLKSFKDKADIGLSKTQVNNIQVQRILHNVGFKVITHQCTFHRWLNVK